MKRALKAVEKVQPLSRRERHELAQHMQNIKLGFIRAGEALGSIRDGRLYRESHRTFEAFVFDVFGYRRRYAYDLIASAELASNLGVGFDAAGNVTEGGKVARIVKYVKPTTERQARALLKVNPEQVGEVFEVAVIESGRRAPTARKIMEVATKMSAICGQTVCANGAQKPAPARIENTSNWAQIADVRKALGILKSVSNQTKNIRAAIDLLTTEINGGAVTVKETQHHE